MLEFLSLLFFGGGYNTNIVFLGASTLGISGGVMGVFLVLRKRALMSDAVSHAMLPGVCVGFLLLYILGISGGRDFTVLLFGALITGILGTLSVQWIRDQTRLTEDTAIGSVLSTFFGLGMVLLSFIQTLSVEGKAGLSSVLLGQIAALTRMEAEVIFVVSVGVCVVCVLFLRVFVLVCFDRGYCESIGWSGRWIDFMMMGLMLVILSVGLKTVGLVLIIALLIIPAASARFCTDDVVTMVILSGIFGGLSGYVGTGLSAFLSVPTGGIIVVSLGVIFFVCFLFGTRRGVLVRFLGFLYEYYRRRV